MDRPVFRESTGPEAKIQAAIVSLLRTKEWYVKETHGNIYQSGLPDLFATHTRYGHRWIEVKNPVNYKFTPAQVETFPKLCANGSGVWILVAGTEEVYKKLFLAPNWWTFTLAW